MPSPGWARSAMKATAGRKSSGPPLEYHCATPTASAEQHDEQHTGHDTGAAPGDGRHRRSTATAASSTAAGRLTIRYRITSRGLSTSDSSTTAPTGTTSQQTVKKSDHSRSKSAADPGTAPGEHDASDNHDDRDEGTASRTTWGTEERMCVKRRPADEPAAQLTPALSVA